MSNVAHDADERNLFGADILPGVSSGKLPVPAANPAPFAATFNRRLMARGHQRAVLTGNAIRNDCVREIERGGLFLLVPVLFGAGAAVYLILPYEPAAAAVAGWLLALGSAVVTTRLRPLAFRFFLGSLLLATGFVAAQVRTAWVATPMLGSDVTTRIIGILDILERRPDGSFRASISLESTERPRLRFPPARIRVTGRAIPPGAEVGGRISGVVRLQPPRGPVRPHGYDFAFHAYFDRIGATGFFLGKPEMLPAAAEGAILARLARARDAITQRVRGAVPGEAGGIAAALITGDRAGIPEDANEALRLTGLAHVLSISGLHLALVAATVMGALRAAFAVFPGWASRHRTKQYSAAVAFAAVTVYLTISGGEVATQRSYIMIGVMLLALVLDRNALTMRNLAIAALAILVLQPEQVLAPGFQMSFAATAALIAAYGWWAERRVSRRTPRSADPGAMRYVAGKIGVFAVGLAATSVIAGVATGLFAAWHFHRVAPMGLPANLLAMPVVSLIVMPFGLLGMLAMPFGLETFPLRIMAAGIETMVAVARWLAAIGPEGRSGFLPPAALVCLTLALVVAVASTTRLRLAALPLLVAGILLALQRTMPAAIVSEDGRLVALITEADDGRTLVLNRSRPNAFVLENWELAYGATRTEAPGRSERVRCGDGYCLLGSSDGTVLWIETPSATGFDCASVTLVVPAFSPSANPCSKAQALTAAELALRGAAEIHVAAKGRYRIVHALAGPVRPWTAHRRWSRPARNLPPIERRKPAPDENSGTTPLMSTPLGTGKHSATPPAEPAVQ